MSCLQQRRKILVDLADHLLDLLDRGRVRIGLVFLVKRLQQIEILARFRRNILDGGSLSRANLAARSKSGDHGSYVHSHLGERRQVSQGDAHPLGIAASGNQRN